MAASPAMHSAVLDCLKKSFDSNPRLTLIVVIKGRHPFVTNLHGLDLKNPAHSCQALLLMNSYFADQTPQRLQEHFHHVVWFQGGAFWRGERLAQLDKLYFTDIDLVVERLVQAVNAQRVRLVSMEESFVRLASSLRVKYGIPGPKSDETAGFTSKIRMKTIARTQSIPTCNFQIVSPAGLLNSDEYMQSIEQFVGFPMVLKPAHGVSGVGVAKINDSEQLRNWLRENGQNYSTYLAEEELRSCTEYMILALVKGKHVQFFSPIIAFFKSPLASISQGLPIALMTANHSQWLNDRAKTFAARILDAMTSKLNSLVVVRLYLTDRVHGEFKFAKMSCRIPNPLCCAAFEQASGVSPETVHLMTQVCEVDLRLIEGRLIDSGQYFGLVAYPAKRGVLTKVPDVGALGLKSQWKLITSVPVGQTMEKARHMSDVCLAVHLFSADHDVLQDDIKLLYKDYAPCVELLS